MKRSRLRLASGAMIVTLILICGFQVYWLAQNYEREKQLLRKETSVILRETGFALQFGDIGNLPGVKFRFEADDDPDQLQQVSNTEIKRISPDSIRTNRTQIMIAITGNDSTRKHMQWETGKEPLTAGDTLEVARTFSLKPVNEKDLEKAFRKALDSARMPMTFQLRRINETELGKHDPDVFATNAIPTGMDHLSFFKASFSGYTPFLWKRIWPQLLISLLIVCITVFTFVLLYRTLIRQKKITEQKDQFISNITHELKTPIATVSVALEALKNFNVLNDPKRTSEYLDISQKELQRLSLLVDKVLKLSMFENNMLEIHTEPLDFYALAEEVCSAMKLQFEKSNVTFNVIRTGSDFQISGDRLHLSGVLFNLLDNALKYGGENPVITLELVSDENEIRAAITDNGIGIAPEYRKKIFEKFFRIQEDNRHDVKGYGLGLSYAAGIVKRHGGHITIDSTPGKGSCFTVILPKKHG